MGLLSALLGNESGGQNIANTHASTSSGQAQGYFQITTGTWNDFGGTKYAPNPLGATYAEQADIASKIPLKRWDSSTLAAMRATGKSIDPNLTLGQNLAMNGEDFGTGQQSLSSYMSSKTGNSKQASSPEQAADQANASQGGTSVLASIINSIFGPALPNVGLATPLYGSQAPKDVAGAIAADPNDPINQGGIIASVSKLFTADFWKNATAFIVVLLVAIAFLIFGSLRIIKS